MGGDQSELAAAHGLPEDEVHVRLVALKTVSREWPDWAAVLSDEEIAKSNAFIRPEDRARSALTRACLRLLLSEYAGRPPDQLKIQYNGFGKPLLDKSRASVDLEFSVSHSGDFALFGFAAGRSIGVDIELIRSEVVGEIVSITCSPSELRILDSLAEDLRTAEFFKYWTLKEAYVKALGVGLSFPLNRVEISVRRGPDTPPSLRYRLRVSGTWSAFTPEAIPRYALSAVASGKPVFRFQRGITVGES